MPQLTWASKSVPDPMQATLNLDSIIYPNGVGYPLEWPANHLILGDNLAVISALLKEFEGKIDLIYADPPFFTNRRYPARIGRGEDSRRPREWKLAEGYPDQWRTLDDYLDMLYPRLVWMHRLLAPHGTLYLHLDWHADAYARLLLDEIFGPQRLLNEIIWIYHGPSPIRRAFNRKHDTILAYTKGDHYTFNVDAVRQPYDINTVKTFASSPRAGFGKVPDLERGKVPEDWWYFPVVARLHQERTGYPTQKPEALLERILLASSNPGDLVADFFAGSGTAALVAARLGRRFIAADIAWRAIHVARCRLAGLSGAPFTIQTVQTPEQSLSVSNVEQNPTWLHPSLRWVNDQISISLEGEMISWLDYWEVDPDWDGRVFRSAVQVVRPRTGEATPTRVCVPGVMNSRPLAIRLVTIQGERFQVCVDKPAG